MSISDTKSDISEHTYICELTENMLFIEEIGNVVLYGINMYNSDESKAKLDGEHCCIEDISDDYEAVCKLKNLIVECDLYPVHLKDVVEDFLS